MKKRSSSSSSGGSGGAARPVRPALLMALSLAGALVYVFVLLVPAWRTVRVDRALIGSLLANQSDATDAARLWDALTRDPLLRSRSANAFRECLTGDDGFNTSAVAGAAAAETDGNQTPALPEDAHLLESLAGLVNATETGGRSHKRRSSPAARDRCWFLDLRWSTDGSGWSRLTAAHRSLLHCTRALFLIAVCLLLCYCVCLTGSLYVCFAARLAGPCRPVLAVVHCLSLSQLVALAVLQDVSARLTEARLADLLAAAGFPDGCPAGVTARRGVCCLVLFCALCIASAVQMLLILLPPTAGKHPHRRGDDQISARASAASASDKADDAEKLRECDDAEDTNPLI